MPGGWGELKTIRSRTQFDGAPVMIARLALILVAMAALIAAGWAGVELVRRTG